MKVTVCQLDNRPGHMEPMLAKLAEHVSEEDADFLLLPELCFGPWLAADREPDEARWRESVVLHEAQIAKLGELGAEAAMGTRPAMLEDGNFRNEAYLWTREGGARGIHEKYYLPNEPFYWEANWYQRGERRFDLCRALGLGIGVRICTEMWFFEWARRYAVQGADLLCVPRATPHASVRKWLAGGQAAAVCSGAYCLSSNLWNPPGGKADCGGLGWIISPEGDVLAETGVDEPFATVTVDPEWARRSKSTYPRYVEE